MSLNETCINKLKNLITSLDYIQQAQEQMITRETEHTNLI
jgi:hypothetical protein